MSGVSKRGLEEQQPNEEKTELYDGMGSWGDERPFKLARKEPREHERRMSIPQSQSPWQQPPHSRSSYSSFYLEPSHTHDIKEREAETQVKAVEGKDEIKESKIDIKLEPREIKDAHHEIKDPKVGIKDQHHHHNHHHYQYPQLESERIGDRDIVMEDGEFIGENRVGDWKKEERKRKEEGASERKEKDKKKEENVKGVEVKEEIVEAEGKDIDEKDRKKEKESQEKRMKQHIQDREGPDDGICDGEGGSERDRGDSFGHGPPSLQRNKRMQRSRAHSMPGRDVRSRFKPKDNDGLPGRSESSAVVYKVGESVQETIKLWKEFEASQALKCGENSSVSYPTLEIRIPAEHVTTANHQVRGSQLWGTDIYTDDSDVVAVLMHSGYYRPTVIQPPQTIHELRAVIVVLPPQESYISTLRNSVRSRAWGAASGCSYKVDKCRLMKKGGGSIELEPFLVGVSAVAPTLALAATERSMTTRAAASNAYRQHRFVREVTIQYNLCNEPWMKYSIGIVADRGLKKSQFTSARLKKGEVLYVETHKNRYELSYDGEKVSGNGSVDANTATLGLAQTANNSERADKAVTNENEKHLLTISQNGDKILSRSTNEVEKTQNGGEAADRYKWARCKQPLPQTVLKQIGIPLAPEHIEILEENLDWEELQWSQTSVWIRGKEYVLARAHFMSFN